jgi:hypothetical protein
MEPFYRHWQGSVEKEDALSIDDGSKASDNEEGIFDMDDSSADDNDDNRLPAVVSDQDVRKDIEADIDNDEEDDETDGMKTPDVYEKKEMQRKAWTETTKRPRSQSMENGSW